MRTFLSQRLSSRLLARRHFTSVHASYFISVQDPLQEAGGFGAGSDQGRPQPCQMSMPIVTFTSTRQTQQTSTIQVFSHLLALFSFTHSEFFASSIFMVSPIEQGGDTDLEKGLMTAQPSQNSLAEPSPSPSPSSTALAPALVFSNWPSPSSTASALVFSNSGKRIDQAGKKKYVKQVTGRHNDTASGERF